MTFAYGSNEGRWCWTAKGCVVIGGEFLFGLVKTKDAVNEVSRRRAHWGVVYGNGPQTARHSFPSDDDFVSFEDFHLVFVEIGDTVVIADLSKGDEGAGA